MSYSLINAATGTRYVASYQIVLAGGPAVTVNGRTYASGANITVDHFSLDLPILQSAGWIALADATGPTSGRPVETEHGYAMKNGYRYLDTTLGKVVIRANSAWLDINTGLVA
jgi:hypothetical protein